MKNKNLDELSTAIERLVKNLRGGAATPTKKRMPLDEFVTYALKQLGAAAKDEPEVAKRRLAALKRSVDDVIAKVAKMAAEDTDSEKIKVDVETAFAPTRAQGDTPMADLTTASDQSSTEMSVAGIAAPAGDSAFAENLQAATKALKKLQADLETGADDKPRKQTKKAERSGDEAGADAAGEGGDDTTDAVGEGADRGTDRDGWPMDLNTEAFRKGDRNPDAALIWGADPDGVASQKPR